MGLAWCDRYNVSLTGNIFADLLLRPIPESFYSDMVWLFLSITAVSVFNFLGLWCGRMAAVYLQQGLVLYSHELYFNNKVLYTANCVDSRLDNIDNRLAGDMELLSTSFSTFFYGDGSLNSHAGLYVIVCVSFIVIKSAVGFQISISTSFSLFVFCFPRRPI